MSPALATKEACPVKEHVATLHDRAAGILGVFVVSVVYANTTGPKDAMGSVTHHRVGDVAGMVGAITAHAETPHANVYMGLHVMRSDLARGSRGTEADIVAVLGLVADMDADTGKVGGLPLEPSFVIETSPGNRQPGWLFSEPLTREGAVPIAKALQRATASDFGTGDVTHVWRIPGTLNWPNRKKLERGRPSEPADVTMLQPFDGELVDAADLWEAVKQHAVAPSENRPLALGALPSVDRLDVSYELAELLAANDVDDRSRHAAAVVEKMGFDGLTAEEGAALFFAATGNWVAKYKSESAMEKDFARLWPRFAAEHAEAVEAGGRAVATLLSGTRKATPIAANDNDPDDATAFAPIPAAKGLPEDLCYPPGAVGEFARFVTSCSRFPSAHLSLVAALALVAGLVGRRYKGPTGLR